MRNSGKRRPVIACGMYALALGCCGATRAQNAAPAAGSAQPQNAESTQGARRGQYAGMGRVAGEVTAVNGNSLTVKAEDGSSVTVVATDNTRLMKDRGPVKLSDLHVGDGLMAFGNMDAPNHTLHAAMVMAEDAAQIKAMRENLGKTYITGRVTAIDLDNAKMTVERPDHVSQTIGLDEGTSFKRAVRGERPAGTGTTSNPGDAASARPAGGNGGGMGRGGMMMADPTAALERGFANGESITLADIKVGDFVVATGSVKAGVFVPARVLESRPRPRAADAPGSAPAAAAQPPSGPGQQ